MWHSVWSIGKIPIFTWQRERGLILGQNCVTSFKNAPQDSNKIKDSFKKECVCLLKYTPVVLKNLTGASYKKCFTRSEKNNDLAFQFVCIFVKLSYICLKADFPEKIDITRTIFHSRDVSNRWPLHGPLCIIVYINIGSVLYDDSSI